MTDREQAQEARPNVYRPSECYAVSSGNEPMFVTLNAYNETAARLRSENDELRARIAELQSQRDVEWERRKKAQEAQFAAEQQVKTLRDALGKIVADADTLQDAMCIASEALRAEPEGK